MRLFALVAADALPLLPVAIIAVREIGISLYRVQLGRQGLAVPARLTAKIKTFLQSLTRRSRAAAWTARYHWIANALLWASVFMALFSGFQYLRDGRRAATTMQDD